MIWAFPGAARQSRDESKRPGPRAEPETGGIVRTLVVGKPGRLDDLTHLWTSGAHRKLAQWVSVEKPPFSRSGLWTVTDWYHTMSGEEILGHVARGTLREILLADPSGGYLDIVALSCATGTRTRVKIRPEDADRLLGRPVSLSETEEAWVGVARRYPWGWLERAAAAALAAVVTPFVFALAVWRRGKPSLAIETLAGEHGRPFRALTLPGEAQGAEDDDPGIVQLFAPEKAAEVSGQRSIPGKMLLLWCVARGEMGFFGPAPVRAGETLKWRAEDLTRLQVRPGVFQWPSATEAENSQREDLSA